MTIEVHWSFYFLFAAKDGEDVSGLKLETNWPIFFKFGDGVLRRSPKINIKYE